ncbi:ATP synthase F1 subunit gamma [Blattabacterium cuenoti]|uniref:ATP synthase F1 subunit gamma n=1 Tax=Blattabacterium cuenoti TaxID=1653831 RepID=UPI00163BAF74|nr:ATP synthase F1 subunit gamma [Blattabacterium cuenoti]
MSNPKEIKRRILSIESVIKTTEAMRMISIVKLQKSKDFLMHVKTYFDHIELLFLNVLSTEKRNNFYHSKYFLEKGNKKLFIVFTSNRGLCGSFNSLIFSKIDHFIQKKSLLHNKYIFFSIGKKGFDFLNKKYNIYMYKKNNNWIDYDNFTKKIQIFTKKLIIDFFNKKFSSIYLMYNNLKKSLFQEIIIEKFLPISVDLNNLNTTGGNYILEPSQKEIIDHLIPKFLNTKLLKIFLKSITAEHTARMISMHQATENASNIKNDLILNYNKERQTTITKEILEIISGLESLN